MHQEARSMATKGKRPMRALTAGDKIDAIQRVNDGESKASVARDIGVPESTLRGWCKNEDKLRYMSTRHSTPDTDKSSDGDCPPPEKRARAASPPAPAPAPRAHSPDPASPPDACLDLSSAAPPAPAARPSPPHADPASVSMTAISPLSGLNHLSAAPAHLAVSFNDIATNLSLIAQLNPGLGAQLNPGLGALGAIGTGARTLRSVRSPKPSHAPASAAPLNLSDKHRGKEHPAPAPPPPPPAPAVDDALWYWLKTQQAMLDLAAAPKEPSRGAKPLAAPLDAKSSWFWQYCKRFGGALPPPAPAPAPPERPAREKSENILYSHLTKAKPEAAPSSHARARTVLDDLLFNGDNVSRAEGREDARCNAENEWDGEVADALAHGDKFLAWLEACRDPSVTRLHVHQLRGLIHNIRARAERKATPAAAAAPAAPAPLPAAPLAVAPAAPDRVSRRK